MVTWQAKHPYACIIMRQLPVHGEMQKPVPATGGNAPVQIYNSLNALSSQGHAHHEGDAGLNLYSSETVQALLAVLDVGLNPAWPRHKLLMCTWHSCHSTFGALDPSQAACAFGPLVICTAG